MDTRRWIHHLLDVRAVQYPEVNYTGASQDGQTIYLQTTVYLTFKDNNTGRLDSAVWTCYWSKFEPRMLTERFLQKEVTLWQCSSVWCCDFSCIWTPKSSVKTKINQNNQKIIKNLGFCVCKMCKVQEMVLIQMDHKTYCLSWKFLLVISAIPWSENMEILVKNWC